jgi:hypothetical protein
MVFLDEVGEMTLRMQGCCCGFLETGELQKVGADGGSRTSTSRHRGDQPQSARTDQSRSVPRRLVLTASTSSTSWCRRCAIGAKTFPNSLEHFLGRYVAGQSITDHGGRRRRR